MFYDKMEELLGAKTTRKYKRQLQAAEEYERQGKIFFQGSKYSLKDYFSAMLADIFDDELGLSLGVQSRGNDENICPTIFATPMNSSNPVSKAQKMEDAIKKINESFREAEGIRPSKCQISDLFVEGLPPLREMYNSDDCKYIGQSIACIRNSATVKLAKFSVLRSVNTFTECSYDSLMLLPETRCCPSDMLWVDRPVQRWVLRILEEMTIAARLFGQTQFSGRYFMSALCADTWVAEIDRVPVCAVDMLHSVDELTNSQHIGAFYDRLTHLQSQYKRKHIFGILTCYDAWRIVWLPDSDWIATAKSIATESNSADAAIRVVTPLQPRREKKHFISDYITTEARELHGTDILAYDDKSLPRILVSLFRKLYSVHLRRLD
jgi:hypothetical protein